MKGKVPWTLVDNDLHKLREFPSEKKLRQYARKKGMLIHRQIFSPRGFYSEAVGYIPGKPI